MRCPACQVDNPAAARFCSDCGQRLPAACNGCGAALLPNARFCSDCGAPAAAPVGARTAPAPAAAPLAIGSPGSLESGFAAMQRVLPSSVRTRLLAEADGENRVLTILFADLTGSVRSTASLHPEDAAALVNDVLRAMVDAVLEYDGRINRLLGDAVLAFFGTPQAHENDPERAILAALRIRERVQALGLDVTAGINTGEVYLGAVGSSAHHEITAMGAAINLAARMREKARPGEILVGEATHRHTRRAFAFDEREIEAKGFDGVLPAYAVRERLSRPDKVRGIEGLRADLIGRDDELAKLRDALEEVRRGRGQVVSLIGEAGVGKSRLVADLKTIALGDSERAPRWLEGRCLDVGMAVSYWPFLDLFRAAFDFAAGDDDATRAARIVDTLRPTLSDERLREVVPVLADLVSVRLGPEWPARASASPEQSRQQTFLAIRDALLALARDRGLVLVLDDLHWSDGLSLDVVSLLMDAITLAPVLLVCVYRPDREHRVWHLGSAASRKCADRYTEVQLRELTPRQSRQLIASLLRIEELPSGVSELILAKAQGNPFFVEEVVRSLIDAGMIVREGDGWRARPDIGEVAVPESIQSVILSRVDRLQDDVRRVLQSASVIGRVFRRRLLGHVTRQEDELDRALWELEERAMIYEGRVTPEPEYSFQHQLTQDTVYHNILRRHRTGFHRQVAEAIEALYADGLDEFFEQLAYHFERAGATEKALEYLVKSAEKAARSSAPAEATGYYDRALELCPDGEEADRLRLRRAESLLDLFRGREAVEAFDAVLAAARERGRPAQELPAMLGLGRALYILSLDDQTGGAVERSRETYEAAYLLADRLGDKSAMIRALLGTQWMADTWPEYRSQIDRNTVEALELSAVVGDDDLRLESQMARLRFLARSEALELKARLLRELEARRDVPRLNAVLFTFLAQHMRWGDFEEGVAVAEMATRVARELGVPPVQYATFGATCLIGLGRFDEARAWLAREVADESHPFGRALRDLGQGVYYQQIGSHERAAALLPDVIERAATLRRHWMVTWATGTLAHALAGLGRGGEMDDGALRGLSVSLLAPVPPLAQSDLELSRGRPLEALELARGAAGIALDREQLWFRARALGVVAQAALAAGDARQALAVADDAVALCQAKGYRPIERRLHAVRADALAALDEMTSADAARQRAASLAAELAERIHDLADRAAFLRRGGV